MLYPEKSTMSADRCENNSSSRGLLGCDVMLSTSKMPQIC
jgi:hypothetical protein